MKGQQRPLRGEGADRPNERIERCTRHLKPPSVIKVRVITKDAALRFRVVAARVAVLSWRMCEEDIGGRC